MPDSIQAWVPPATLVAAIPLVARSSAALALRAPERQITLAPELSEQLQPVGAAIVIPVPGVAPAGCT